MTRARASSAAIGLRARRARSRAWWPAPLLLAGCADILGVEDVAPDGAGGAGGADASTTTGFGVGAGLPASAGSGESAATGDASSTSSGPVCAAGALPACEGTIANAFESAEELLLGWDLDADEEEAEIKGGRLQLEPRDDSEYVAVSSRAPARVAPQAGACAVWVTIPESEARGSSGIGLGPADAGDAVRVQRSGDSIVAVVAETEIGALPSAPDMRWLRLVFDPAGTVGFEASRDGLCWDPVVAPQPRPLTDGHVRLFVRGKDGRGKFDDYCR